MAALNLSLGFKTFSLLYLLIVSHFLSVSIVTIVWNYQAKQLSLSLYFYSFPFVLPNVIQVSSIVQIFLSDFNIHCSDKYSKNTENTFYIFYSVHTYNNFWSLLTKTTPHIYVFFLDLISSMISIHPVFSPTIEKHIDCFTLVTIFVMPFFFNTKRASLSTFCFTTF